jgi:glycosyltransferase involved in cell wall biosynthesis
MTDSDRIMGDSAAQASRANKVGLSLVIPVLNESSGVALFLDAVRPILRRVAERHPELDGWEFIFVDDGSTDNTVEALIAERQKDPTVKIIRLTRNFGKDIALSAGLAAASGRAAIPIDVDLQDPPEAILDMVEKWRQGFDVVFAVRVNRDSDSAIKRLTARWFYRIFNAISDTAIPPDAGDYRLLDARVVEALCSLPEHSRFMKGLYSWVGFRQTAIEIDRKKRAAGESRWRYGTLWRFALGGIVTFSTVPLRVWTYIGVLISMLGIAYAIFLALRVMIEGVDLPGYASLMVVVLVMGGINLLTLGIIGEYVAQIHSEAKRRPLYLVEERIGFGSSVSPRSGGSNGSNRI